MYYGWVAARERDAEMATFGRLWNHVPVWDDVAMWWCMRPGCGWTGNDDGAAWRHSGAENIETMKRCEANIERGRSDDTHVR